ncbi:hypothetical protein J7400_18805 [Shimia sp. R9_2]|uniref:TipJ family phage tail tip protein n=1 Tax=Shimia sp. R9_2 TaxID=2821112 RepID=UPI001ADAF304|nr:hypothetical protein [Shimia sp. R9_2]MBO9398728.1 hypothetical protein [Shimia sp. R9_2]
MLDSVGRVEGFAHTHPLRTDKEFRRPISMHEGVTIAEIVRDCGIEKRFLADVQVVLSRGKNRSIVPMDQWSKVRPKAGAFIEIGPQVGALAGAALAALLPSAASFVAGTALGLTAGTLTYAVAYAGVTIVGSLLINALIPPPSLPGQTNDNPNFTITGQSNAESRYGIYPTVLGRHLMYPPKTARGYTEGGPEDIYYRGRFTFGYGPVALETLKIGTTPITDFEDIEIEFLNVDQAETLKHMPDLAPMVKAWRTGTQHMSLYPDDIAEDGYSVRLLQNTPVVRRTRDRAISATVDITYQGLTTIGKKGGRHNRTVEVAFAYRLVGATAWIDAGTEKHTGRSTSNLRFSKTFDFGSEGEYEIQITRITWDSDETTVRDDAFLTAIRSVQTGELPSHEHISEIALRIKASDQLNGQIDTLNGVVLQMAPVWDGSSWSALQPVRHPAWIFARTLMGPMLSRPQNAAKLQLQDLRDWYLEEPHWTCDMVIDQPTQVGEILSLICGAGRARRTLRDLKFSIIRDGADGPVVQQFSPRNSYGFQGLITFPKEIHGFRVRCISERLGWQQDEIVVYADGYDATNATEFETLDLQGVVLAESDADGGNAWRLGRYHLAQAILRPETFEWNSDLDHLRVNMGDKVRLVHDVPLIGVGAGRIASVNTHSNGDIASFVLDEFMSPTGSSFRARIRTALGNEVVVTAAPPSSFGGVWTVQDFVSGDAVAPGDHVVIEEVGQESMEVLVQSIQHQPNGQARLVGVPAAPAVLQADQGTIPTYTPTITKVVPNSNLKPLAPRIIEAYAENEIRANEAGDRSVQVFGKVKWIPGEAFSADDFLVYVTEPDGNRSKIATTAEQGIRFELPELGRYSIEIIARNRAGISSAGFAQIERKASGETPEDVSDFRSNISGDQMQLKWPSGEALVSHYHLRRLPLDADGGWGQSALVDDQIIANQFSMPARDGRYLIKAVSLFGRESRTATELRVESAGLAAHNVVLDVSEHPSYAGTLSPSLIRDDGQLLLNATGDGVGDALEGVYEFADVVDLSEVYSSRVTADVRGFGFLVDNVMSSWTSLAELDNLTGTGNDTWSIEVELSITRDDPNSGSAVWSDWQPLQVGDYIARGYRFRANLKSFSSGVAVRINQLSVMIDMPDRVLGADDVICPQAGVQVDFDLPFKAKPAITVDGQGLPTGAVSIRTNVTRSGFHQRYEDQQGNPINCTFDWVAKGFGRTIV